MKIKIHKPTTLGPTSFVPEMWRKKLKKKVELITYGYKETKPVTHKGD